MAPRKQAARKAPASAQKQARPAAPKARPAFAPFKPFDATSFNPKDMEKVMNKAQSQFVQFDKLAQDASSTSKESMEALTESVTIAQRGAETIMKLCMEVAQDASQRNSEAFKQIMRCKTINELAETNNKLAQEAFDETMSQVTRLSEMCIKTCTEAFEPINDQVSKAIKKASDTMAA